MGTTTGQREYLVILRDPDSGERSFSPHVAPDAPTAVARTVTGGADVEAVRERPTCDLCDKPATRKVKPTYAAGDEYLCENDVREQTDGALSEYAFTLNREIDWPEASWKRETVAITATFTMSVDPQQWAETYGLAVFDVRRDMSGWLASAVHEAITPPPGLDGEVTVSTDRAQHEEVTGVHAL